MSRSARRSREAREHTRRVAVELMPRVCPTADQGGSMSDADELRKVIEVLVSSVQRQIVLQHQRRQPHVVGRNRRALFAELAEQRRVMMRRLVVGKEHAHAVLHEEVPEYPLVLGLPLAVSEASPKLTNHDERQRNGFGFLQERHRLGDTFAKIDVSVRVEGNSHRQRPSSTWSCTASADSSALSAFQVPAISPRSLRFRGAPAIPAPSAKAATAASFRLLRAARARSRNAVSRAGGIPRMVYCMHSV